MTGVIDEPPTAQVLLDAVTKQVLALPVPGSQKGLLVDSLALLFSAHNREQCRRCRHELQGMIDVLESDRFISHREGTDLLTALIALWHHLDTEHAHHRETPT